MSEMPKNRFSHPILLTLLAISIAFDASAYNWDDVSPEDLNATECEFDPNAAAEVLYKEIIYDLTDENVRIIKTHIRTKIYEKSALDHARRTKIWYNSAFKISSVHARVIKQDGTYIEIENDDVVTQTESKKNGRALKSTTISIPQVEVGDIVEYLFRNVLERGYYLPKDEVSFQEEWPIRKLYLKMKPYVYRGSGFKWTSNRIDKRMEETKGGFYEISLENQPGYPEEPYQAPDTDAKSWFAFYNVISLTAGDAFWKGESKSLYKQMLSNTKSDSAIEAKVAELSAGKNTNEEKLQAFYDFCRSSLINSVHGKADRLTQSQRDDLDNKWSASKTLKKGFGTTRNINTVFCALARAAGIDARLSFCADRSEYAFTRVMEDVDVALPHSIVAIKNGENWTFYNPAAKYMPFGQLDWIHDDVTALVPDKKKLIFAKTQSAVPSDNTAKAEGTFELSESGDLSGTLALSADGNHALVIKQLLDEKSEKDRDESIEDMLESIWSNGKFDNIKIENADNPFGTLKIECDLKIPNYAESVGSRLFLQPNMEKRYSEAEFPSATRMTSIFFNYKFREESNISITLPEGYVLEAPSAPKPFAIEGFMDYAPKLVLKKTSNTLVYTREFDFYGNQYPAKVYPAIKNAFDNLLAEDHHALTLKKAEANADSSESDSNNS